jgi:hypothetical protein
MWRGRPGHDHAVTGLGGLRVLSQGEPAQQSNQQNLQFVHSEPLPEVFLHAAAEGEQARLHAPDRCSRNIREPARIETPRIVVGGVQAL